MKVLGKGICTENIFRQATEDVSHYQWALSEWFGPTGEYSDDYLLLEIFERRSRAQKILSIVDKYAGENQCYLDKLCTIMNNEEPNYDKFLKDTRIYDIFKISLMETLNYLKNKLKEVVGLYNDYNEDEDECTHEELRDAQLDFIQLFVKLYYLRENYPNVQKVQPLFYKELKILESDFKNKFHYFETIADILAFQRNNFSPSEKEWWFVMEPDRYRNRLFAYLEGCLEITEKEHLEKHLQQCTECKCEIEKMKKIEESIGKMALLYQQPVGEECPEAELLSRFAYDKEGLSENLRNAVEQHVHICIHCLNDVITLRAIEAVPREIKYKPIPIKYRLLNFFRKTVDKVQNFGEAINNNSVREFQLAYQSVGMGSSNEEKNVESICNIYAMKLSGTTEKQIALLPAHDDPGCPADIKPLCEVLKRAAFYYKVFGFYIENGEEVVKEINTGKDQYLPFKIDHPNTDFLLLCLSKDEKLTSLKSDDVFEELKGKTGDLIGIFVEIERANKTKK